LEFLIYDVLHFSSQVEILQKPPSGLAGALGVGKVAGHLGFIVAGSLGYLEEGNGNTKLRDNELEPRSSVDLCGVFERSQFRSLHGLPPPPLKIFRVL
jgi:hypothetical protein